MGLGGSCLLVWFDPSVLRFWGSELKDTFVDGEGCGSDVSEAIMLPQALPIPEELLLVLAPVEVLVWAGRGPGWLQRLGEGWGGEMMLAPPELPPNVPPPSCPNMGQAEGLALGFRFKLKLVVEDDEEEPQPLLPPPPTGLSLFPSLPTEDWDGQRECPGPEPQLRLAAIWLESMLVPVWLVALGPLLDLLLRWLVLKWPVWLLAPVAIFTVQQLLVLLLLVRRPGSVSKGHPPVEAWLWLRVIEGQASVSVWSMISWSQAQGSLEDAALVALLLAGRCPQRELSYWSPWPLLGGSSVRTKKENQDLSKSNRVSYIHILEHNYLGSLKYCWHI